MQLFNFKPTEHGVTVGAPPKMFAVSETNKAGVTVGYYLICAWLPPGSAGIITAGSGYSFEIPVTDAFFTAAKASGQFTVIEFRQEPDGGADALRNQYEAAIKMRDQAMARGDWSTYGMAWQIIYSVKAQADALGVDISFWYKPLGAVGGK